MPRSPRCKDCGFRCCQCAYQAEELKLETRYCTLEASFGYGQLILTAVPVDGAPAYPAELSKEQEWKLFLLMARRLMPEAVAALEKRLR